MSDQLVTIGARLRQERERLGLTQAEFSAAAGIGRKAQGHYETDERSPDADYLAAISQAGADILYIVTGRPSPVDVTAYANALAHGAHSLDEGPTGRVVHEAAVLLLLRNLNEADLSVVRRMLEGLVG